MFICTALFHFPCCGDSTLDDKTCPSATDSLIAENSTITMHDGKINFSSFHPMFQSQQIPEPHLINLFHHEFSDLKHLTINSMIFFVGYFFVSGLVKINVLIKSPCGLFSSSLQAYSIFEWLSFSWYNFIWYDCICSNAFF